MGGIVSARCECGFEVDSAFLGGGLANYMDYCGAPAMCPRCQRLVIANYLGSGAKCEDCGDDLVFYNDQTLCGPCDMASAGGADPSDCEPNVFEWSTMPRKPDLVLYPGARYRCPQCGDTRMQFRDAGCWD